MRICFERAFVCCPLLAIGLLEPSHWPYKISTTLECLKLKFHGRQDIALVRNVLKAKRKLRRPDHILDDQKTQCAMVCALRKSIIRNIRPIKTDESPKYFPNGQQLDIGQC